MSKQETSTAGRLKDKLAFITGGNTGIGLGAARQFVQEGARVAIMGRNQATLDEAAAELGDRCLAICGDVSKLEDLDSAIDQVKAQFGALDIVFANAGILHGATFGATDIAKFDEMFAINVRGAYFTIEKALPLLRANASIILVSSVARHIGATKVAGYAATKGAVRAMAKALAGELAPRGIRVNVVCPGPTDTEMWRSLARIRPGASNVTRQIPLGRLGEVKDIANVVTFLASDESTWITGTEIIADGGRVEASGGAAVFQS